MKKKVVSSEPVLSDGAKEYSKAVDRLHKLRANEIVQAGEVAQVDALFGELEQKRKELAELESNYLVDRDALLQQITKLEETLGLSSNALETFGSSRKTSRTKAATKEEEVFLALKQVGKTGASMSDLAAALGYRPNKGTMQRARETFNVTMRGNRRTARYYIRA
jgi:hypothetical protein